jgi:tryptophanase
MIHRLLALCCALLLAGCTNFMELRQELQESKTQLGRVVLDCSLLGENAYLVLKREEEFKNSDMKTVIHAFTSLADLCYFSARKISSSRGGGMCTDNPDIIKELEAFVPLYEGFTTYGGISIREIESMAVGLYITIR